MGNVQTSSIGNQIYPAESYVQDIDSLRYIRSLGDTRFMKTACVESKDGLSVVKLFVLNENFKHLESYIGLVNHIRKKLKESSNCLAFTRTFSTERCIILHRPFRKYTLYDRLSTRPFLLDIEKKWIAFQLLKTLSQCRINSICHGDIKTQNVLISSSNWVHLTDFAPFKPTFIPYDNPSTFTFFFDTSRRRTCYLAPERFKKAEDLNYFPRRDEFVSISEGLTESMDIFSMGCVLVELLTDGRHVAFNLSQGIDYTRMETHITDTYLEKLLSVCPPDFKQLLSIMLDRNETKRKENFEKYFPCNSDLFPPIFETFLYRYFKDLLAIQKPDEIILKLYVEFPNYQQTFEKGDKNAIVLIISMVTANLRACQSMSTKMDAIALLKKLSEMCDPALVADRVIPYLVALLQDYYAQIRAEAIFAITEILDKFSVVPEEESRLLVDFVLIRLKPLTDDPSEFVKIALASCLGRLAIISLRFFNEATAKLNNDMSAVELQGTNDPDEETINRIIGSERSALQKSIANIFTSLCGSCHSAKQCLFDASNLELLCKFFRIDKDDDNISMHMMTLPNNKSDWALRATFFQCYPIVARNLNTVQNLKPIPFIQQSFHDPEEFVTYYTFSCLYQLFDNKLLEKSVIFALLPDIVPFLIHPNKWFRNQVVNILSVLDSVLIVADIYSKLVPLVRPYLTESLIRLNDKEVVLSCLIDPIPRQIWELVTECEHIENLLHSIEKQRTLDKLGGGRHSFFSAGTSPESMQFLSRLDPSHTTMVNDILLESITRKLKNLGMNEQIEDQLLSAQSLLKKMNLSKRGEPAVTSPTLKAQFLLSAIPNAKKMVFDMDAGIHKPVKLKSSVAMNLSEAVRELSPIEVGKNRVEVPFEVALKSKLPLSEAFAHKQLRYREQKRVTSPLLLATPRDQNDASAIPVQQPNVMIASTSTKSALSNLLNRQSSPHIVRRPELRLVSHLHEHSGAVIQLAVQPHKERFASCATDNMVKIWSSSQTHLKENPATISLNTLNFPNRTNSLAFMQGNDAHLAMGRGSELVVHDIDGNRLLRSYSVDKEIDGFVSKVLTSDHLIYALTHHSGVYCFDLRASGNQKNQFLLDPIFLQRTRNSYGLTTGFSVDFINQHWMLITTSSSTTKNIVLWDLRFSGLEVASWSHPSKYATPFRSWAYTSDTTSCNTVFTNSSREGELSLWDLGTRDRIDMLWPGSEQPLTYTNELVTSALVSSPQLDGIFTGDSEGSLRYWNMNGHAERSNYLCGPYRKFASCWTSNDVVGKSGKLDDRKVFPRIEYYYSKRIDYPMQIQMERRPSPNSSEFDMQMIPHVSDSHRNSISDLISVGTDQLVSADRAGVIKIWKTYIA